MPKNKFYLSQYPANIIMHIILKGSEILWEVCLPPPPPHREKLVHFGGRFVMAIMPLYISWPSPWPHCAFYKACMPIYMRELKLCKLCTTLHARDSGIINFFQGIFLKVLELQVHRMMCMWHRYGKQSIHQCQFQCVLVFSVETQVIQLIQVISVD